MSSINREIPFTHFRTQLVILCVPMPPKVCPLLSYPSLPKKKNEISSLNDDPSEKSRFDSFLKTLGLEFSVLTILVAAVTDVLAHWDKKDFTMIANLIITIMCVIQILVKVASLCSTWFCPPRGARQKQRQSRIFWIIDGFCGLASFILTMIVSKQTSNG